MSSQDTTTQPNSATKRCSRCKQSKPLGEFHNDKSQRDGKARYCKPCKSEVKKANPWYTKYGGKEYMREYSATEEVKAKKKVYARTRHAVVLSNARQRRQYARDPQKALARMRLHREIRAGRFPRASECLCQRCLRPAKEWHHLSYDRWDNVISLCQKHHKEVHKKE